jgi:hypothetical protein
LKQVGVAEWKVFGEGEGGRALFVFEGQILASKVAEVSDNALGIRDCSASGAHDHALSLPDERGIPGGKEAGSGIDDLDVRSPKTREGFGKTLGDSSVDSRDGGVDGRANGSKLKGSIVLFGGEGIIFGVELGARDWSLARGVEVREAGSNGGSKIEGVRGSEEAMGFKKAAVCLVELIGEDHVLKLVLKGKLDEGFTGGFFCTVRYDVQDARGKKGLSGARGRCGSGLWMGVRREGVDEG